MKCSKDAFWKCLKRYISKTIIVLTILFLFILLQISGGKEMMAMLWAQQIMKQETIEEAKAMYEKVPRLLKGKVKQILIDSGMEEIVTEEVAEK